MFATVSLCRLGWMHVSAGNYIVYPMHLTIGSACSGEARDGSELSRNAAMKVTVH